MELVLYIVVDEVGFVDLLAKETLECLHRLLGRTHLRSLRPQAITSPVHHMQRSHANGQILPPSGKDLNTTDEILEVIKNGRTPNS
jgi:hypothetical protein